MITELFEAVCRIENKSTEKRNFNLDCNSSQLLEFQ